MERASQVMIDQPRTLDRGRLGEGPLARLDDAELARVDRALATVFGLDRA